jgi:hypothetical protein
MLCQGSNLPPCSQPFWFHFVFEIGFHNFVWVDLKLSSLLFLSFKELGLQSCTTSPSYPLVFLLVFSANFDERKFPTGIY